MMKLISLAVLSRSLLVASMGIVGTGVTSAEPYPDKSKPIRMIVPTGAASAVDLLARSIAKAISEEAGLNVVVDNKPGAEQAIGVQSLVTSPADGYTLMATSSSSQSLNPVMIPGLKYDPMKDYAPISLLGSGGYILVAHP